MHSGKIGFSGDLTMKVIRAPGPGLAWKLRNLLNLVRGWRIPVANLMGIPTFYGQLWARRLNKDGSVTNFGLVSARVVTTVFVEDMVDEMIAESATWGDYKWHDSGIGTTPAAVGDTAIETTDGESRVEGTQVENAANIYETKATIAYTSTKAITEHLVANDSTAGIAIDHHIFGEINVDNGDSIQFTYRLTCTAGG